MKRLVLPLIAIAPFLTTLIPRAEAGAITADSSVLSPRLIKPGAFRIARNGSLPTGAIKLARLASASNDIQRTVGGLINTGAGTLTLTGSTLFTGGSSGTVNIVGGLSGTGNIGVSQTLSGLTIDSGSIAVPTDSPLSPPSNGVIRLWGSHDPAAATQWLGATGRDINGGTLQVGISNGSIQIGNRESRLVTDPIVISNLAPAAAPVPEPGTAVLLSLGALVFSQVRRRRAV